MESDRRKKNESSNKNKRRKKGPNPNSSSQKKAAAKARYKKRKKTQKIKRLVKELILTFVITGIILVVVFFIFFTGRRVNSHDMLPTLQNKEVLIIERRGNLERLDIVCIDTRDKLNRDYGFYRIIGMPNEIVVYRDDQLMINNQNIKEFFLRKESNSEDEFNNFTTNFSSYDMKSDGKIPKDYYLVLGDNRPFSVDSRSFGLVHKDKIMGKVPD